MSLVKNQLLTTFAARGVAAGGTFLLSYVLATRVSVQDFGSFMICFSIMIGLQVFASIGTDRATLKFMGVALSNNSRNEVRWIYKQAFIINLIVSALLAILLWLLAPIVSKWFFSTHDLGVSSLRITAFVSPLYTIIYLCNFILKGWGRANVSCLFEIGCISIVLSLMIAIFTMLLEVTLNVVHLMSMLSVVLAIYLSIAVGLVISVYKRSGLLSTNKITFNKKFYGSLPDFLLVGVIFFYTQWGLSIVLGLFETERQVAIFSLGLRVAMVVGFILTVYDSILGPRFSRLHHENDLQALKLLGQKSALQMFCFSLVPSIVFLVWPEWILSFFGPEYTSGEGVLRIMVIAQLVNVMTGSVVLFLLMTDNQKAARSILVYSALAAGAASVILIPRLGAEGAAYSLLLCLVIQNFLAVYIVHKRFGFIIIDWRDVLNFRRKC
ncbi:Polysaccharide biosynthesis protein [Halomonas citrativorans]|uniref:Polysaccharide biosynthesis protein n=1 Tax=Halomonas citrativorans TaxID=2742612 RepID=A0A1R4HQM7_9GAMM|nr:polysaccharide biosynthesis C-terminal domain-containing protein [Halomonas citrativorans]SJN09816.1 Polysaccharide biosynthesis protein [Halomonas citrativorans]